MEWGGFYQHPRGTNSSTIQKKKKKHSQNPPTYQTIALILSLPYKVKTNFEPLKLQVPLPDLALLRNTYNPN